VAVPTSRPAATAVRRSSSRCSGVIEVVPLLGLEPRSVRVAAGVGLVDMIEELAGTPQAGARRAFYRPHGGCPAWEPSADPQEVLDEAPVWAAKSGRIEAFPALVDRGADVSSDPYRGTPLAWAAVDRVGGHRALSTLLRDRS
jgi:hypothetical protein